MAIPELDNNIINNALRYIDENGVPDENKSTKYDLIYKDKKYPPKYVVAIARHLKDHTKIDTSDFNAVEAKNFFESRGFTISIKDETKSENSPRNYWLAGTRFSNKEQIDNFVENHYWEGGQVPQSYIMSAIKSVKKGDVLIAKSSWTKGSNHSTPCLGVKAIGLVKSDMTLTDTENWYRCDVDWIKFNSRKDYEGSAYGQYQGTMYLCKDDGLKKLAMETLNIKDDSVSQENIYVKLLKANHNLILHGAPGTGKTYLAKQIAKDMGCSDEEITFVQFHQSYDYTDFVEGLRPAKGENGKADGFELKDGEFKRFCKKAIKNITDSNRSIQETKDDEIFEKIYAELQDDIDNEIITTYKTEKGDLKVSLSSKGQIVFSTKSGRRKNTKKDYLKILFSLLKDKQIVHDKMTQKEIDDIAEKHINGANHLDYIQYRWAINQLVSKYNGIKKENIEATKISRKNFVFIIDEINRGEMSKIFGELFFSIEPSYRGENGKIKTQYQNLVDDDDIFADGFFVPENVYIIGTMNDIDRSVESMDFAMRRRFAFKEIKADDRIEMLTNADKEISQYADEAIQRMQSLNKAIDETEGLSSAYDIGPAYFRKIRYYEGDFQQLWDYHIEGVIREYLRSIDESGEKFTKLKNAYFLIEDQAESSDEPIED